MHEHRSGTTAPHTSNKSSKDYLLFFSLCFIVAVEQLNYTSHVTHSRMILRSCPRRFCKNVTPNHLQKLWKHESKCVQCSIRGVRSSTGIYNAHCSVHAHFWDVEYGVCVWHCVSKRVLQGLPVFHWDLGGTHTIECWKGNSRKGKKWDVEFGSLFACSRGSSRKQLYDSMSQSQRLYIYAYVHYTCMCVIVQVWVFHHVLRRLLNWHCKLAGAQDYGKALPQTKKSKIGPELNVLPAVHWGRYMWNFCSTRRGGQVSEKETTKKNKPMWKPQQLVDRNCFSLWHIMSNRKHAMWNKNMLCETQN